MKYRISHATTFFYSEPVPLGHNEAHLTPRNFGRQSCLVTTLTIDPAPVAVHHWVDYFGNQATFFTLEQEHRQLSIDAESVVEVEPASPPDPGATPAWEEVRDACRQPGNADSLAASQFTFESPHVRINHDLVDYARGSFTPRRPILEAALDLTERIFREFKYDPSATVVNTPVADVFQQRRGVCQDFAHLQIACLRGLGLPARYLSGYLLTDPPPGQPRLVGADASHAWLSIYCPGLGWIDLDPTNNKIPCDRYVTVGWGRDYSDVAPIRGVFLGGGSHTMRVAVDMAPDDDRELVDEA